MISIALFLSMQQDSKPVEVKLPDPPAVVKSLDVVEVLYTGKLKSGVIFDSTQKTNKPFRFQIGTGAVIAGWDQGILGLKVGEEKSLVIPPELGYGAQGAGSDIPPNSTLLFDIKVLRIIPAAIIEVLKEGTGEPLKLGQAVEARISLAVKDGKSLGQTPADKVEKLSVHRSVPFGINQALAGIKAGEKRKVTMNSDLMWGDAGVPPRDTDSSKAGSIVPGKATIVLEVEALKIVKV